MNFLLELFANLIYICCFIGIGEWFFAFEKRDNRYVHVIPLILVFVTTVIWLNTESWVKVISHMLCICVSLWSVYSEKKRTLLVFYLGVTAILTMISLMFKAVISEIAFYLQIIMTDNRIDLISQMMVLLFIWLIGNYFNHNYPGGLRKIGVNYLLVFSVILFMDSIIVSLLGHFIMDFVVTERKWVLVLIYIGIVIGFLLQIVLLINALITRNIHKENEILAKKYLESQNEHYLYLEKREEETKKFRHDIRNHLLVFEDLLQKRDYQGLETYTQTLHDRVNVFSSHITVNNSIADAILNKYYDEAKDKGIELQVNGHFPLVCTISAYDICTVLSNLLSNAILAEEQAEGKKVSFDIRYTEDEILMALENDYIHELRMENGTFKTTKADGLGHGYGLANVITTIENNGGTISIQTENKRFKVMLAMKNRQGENS